METKTFKSWNGSRELTRDEYIAEWTSEIGKFCMLVPHADLQAFESIVAANAGKAWDKSK